MNELRRVIGREQPLDQFHLSLRRAATKDPAIRTFGCCLVTCADERQGQTRSSFDREVATSLISDATNPRDRVFSVSNLGARYEAGTLPLLDDHYTRKTAGPKLLVVEIASHVGRVKLEEGFDYGFIERFGRRSTCCGALTTLLKPQETPPRVQPSWLDEVTSNFGPARLAALRDLDEPARLVAAAVVHAALQAESAVSDLLHHSLAASTDVLLAAGVSVNQQWADGFLPVAYYHLKTGDGAAQIVSGYSLRTTPQALKIEVAAPRVVVEGGQAMEAASRVQRINETQGAEPLDSEILSVISNLTPQHQEELERRLEAVRAQVNSVRHDPAVWRTYSRPILRGLFRGLSVVQPELGIAALLYEGGEKLLSSHRLRTIVDHGPATLEGRRALQDIEAELQQLNHEDAQQVLEVLLSKQA